MRKHLPLFSALLFCFCIFNTAQAQTDIAPEKKNLIAELIVLTKTNQQIAKITNTILKSMELTYPLTIKRSIESRTDLNAKEKAQLESEMSDSFKSFSKKFRERLPQAVDYPRYVEEAVYPLYDKFFTSKELSDLIAFYRTETGQKVVETMPLVFADADRLSREILLPKVLKLLDEIIEEDLKNARQPPPPKKVSK